MWQSIVRIPIGLMRWFCVLVSVVATRCVIILDIVRVKALTSMAVSFDLCANCTSQGKELVLWASMQG